MPRESVIPESRSSAPPATVTLSGRDATLAKLEPGARVDRYTLLERLGAGAMGVVFAAYDAKLDRRVALKLLRQTATGARARKEEEARLLREAHAMARLSSPHVVSVYDVGIVDDTLYLSLEFVRGGTLRAWQREARRSWREVQRMYLQAGRGLSAAHAAGLVHRDFKPDNVLVSESGLVKVTDFGIASVSGGERAAYMEGVPSESGSRRALSGDFPLTGRGLALGTPGYMAPEQYDGGTADARSDQYALAVALYEALYGERPFRGATLDELRDAARRGDVPAAPAGSDVPAHVRRALLRALSPDREQRYPTVEALLDELARDPDRERRRALAMGAAIVAAGALVLGIPAALNARSSRLCAGSEDEALSTWNPDVQGRVERAMLATKLPYAEDSWRRTRERIDAYMTAWTRSHRKVCEATRLHGAQTESTMTVRMACLERRRTEVQALAGVLAAADEDAASHAVQAAMALTPLEVCDDVTSLSVIEPEPKEPAKRAELDAVRHGLAEVNARLEAGQESLAHEQIEPLLVRARAVGYTPIIAEASFLKAESEASVGRPRDGVIRDATTAYAQSDAARLDTLRAQIATRLMKWTADVGHFDESEHWSVAAEGALSRSGSERARSSWLEASGWSFYARGDYARAVERFRGALEAAKRATSSRVDTAEIERALASSLAGAGELGEAEQRISAAEEAVKQATGELHPARLPFLVTRASVAGARGDDARALSFTLEGIALSEKVAPLAPKLMPYINEAIYLHRLGDDRGALEAADAAIAEGRRLYGALSVKLAWAYASAGDALLGLRRPTEAVTKYELALDIFARAQSIASADAVAALTGKGAAQRLAGRDREGLATLERAVALVPSLPASLETSRAAGDADFALAQALWAHGVRVRAVELARSALLADRAANHVSGAREVERWLASHGRSY